MSETHAFLITNIKNTEAAFELKSIGNHSATQKILLKLEL